MSTTSPTEQPTTAPELTISQKFVRSVEKQMSGALGVSIHWTPLQFTLAQHAYLRIDASLKELQAKGKNVTWGNINMTKLAIDAVHLVNLGLDGLMPNHFSAVPYKNGILSKAAGKDIYDLALRVGYEGHLSSSINASIEPVANVKTFLIFKGDKFVPHFSPKGDWYEYEPASVFDVNEDEIEGGVGFIRYKDDTKNTLVIVTKRDFKRSESASKAKGKTETEVDEETGEKVEVNKGNFWKAHRIEMHEKTVKHRTSEAIVLDPAKINNVSNDWLKMNSADAEMGEEVAENANQDLIVVPPPVSAPQALEQQTESAKAVEGLQQAQGEQREAVPVGAPVKAEANPEELYGE